MFSFLSNEAMHPALAMLSRVPCRADASSHTKALTRLVIRFLLARVPLTSALAKRDAGTSVGASLTEHVR